jgi:hypothetical protein
MEKKKKRGYSRKIRKQRTQVKRSRRRMKQKEQGGTKKNRARGFWWERKLPTHKEITKGTNGKRTSLLRG